MADKSTNTIEHKEVAEPQFTCQRCGKKYGVRQMRRITRFRPLVVVCPECEKSFL